MTFASHQLQTYLETARSIANEAGLMIVEGRESGFAIREKAPSDLVTELDESCDRFIRGRLTEAFPDHVVIGEESGGTSIANQIVWYVDPIDGTSNFAHGLPFFCIAIGATLNGEPLVGVVHAPKLSLTYSAARGLGAFRNQAPIAASSTREISKALLGTGFPADRATNSDNNYKAFQALDGQARGVRRFASAALELCFVADGSIDAFWDLRLKQWDVAASACIAKEAGARISRMDGTDYKLGDPDVLFTNEYLQLQMIDALSPFVAPSARARSAPSKN